MGQLGFFNLAIRYSGLDAKNDPLVNIDAVVMFKAIILCPLYNLSDDQVEYQIRDRLSFMRFLGVGLEDPVPEAKTVWLYREHLAQAGVIEGLFATFDGYLKDQGYLAMGGQIIDASIVAAPR